MPFAPDFGLKYITMRFVISIAYCKLSNFYNTFGVGKACALPPFLSLVLFSVEAFAPQPFVSRSHFLASPF